MAGLTNTIGRKTAEKIIDSSLNSFEEDPQKAMLKLLDYGQKMNVFDDKKFEDAKKNVENMDHKWVKMAFDVYEHTDKNILKQTALNAGYQAGLYGSLVQRKIRKRLGTNVPWTILFDPTSACNLKCTGCWAAEYGHKLNLTFEEMDDIVTQGKELGCYFYLLTGGEPLVRKDDLIRLCEKHNDCGFHAFTNGTLIDKEFCEEVKRVGNLSFAVSLEGFEEANDFRRGEGVFDKVVKAMELMREEGLLFGIAVCYTSKNYKTVTSDEFLQFVQDKGARLAWFFHYMPVEKDAAVDLMLKPDQRKYMIHRIREIRKDPDGFQLFPIDFQNDGEFINGCIAGGKNYLHINANGDVEPCVFIHYSSANIRDTSIKDALAQPLFRQYQQNQPFNENHFRPCPMLENPEFLRHMVETSQAHSTDLIASESAEELCAKCDAYSEEWRPMAEEIWREYHPDWDQEKVNKKDHTIVRK